MTIYDVAECVGKAYPLGFTPTNIQSGFRVSGIFPTNRNIFTDDEFLTFYVSDRPHESLDPTGEECTTPSVEISSNETPSNETPSCSNANISTERNRHITPESIRPFPKSKPRKTSKGGRKPGRCRILTDTPGKHEIDMQQANKNKSKSTSFKKQKVKKVLVKDDFTSSDESLPKLSESSETVSSGYDPFEEINISAEFKLDFILVQLKAKKSIKYYVSQIVTVSEEIKYLKRITDSVNKFTYENDDIYEISRNDVIMNLPNPKYCPQMQSISI